MTNNRLHIKIGSLLLLATLFLSACAKQQEAAPGTPTEQPTEVSQPSQPAQPDQSAPVVQPPVPAGTDQTAPELEQAPSEEIDYDLPEIPETQSSEIPIPDVPELTDEAATGDPEESSEPCGVQSDINALEKCQVEAELGSAISDNDLNLLMQALLPVGASDDQTVDDEDPVDNSNFEAPATFEGEADPNVADSVNSFDEAKCNQLSTPQLQQYCRDTIKFRLEYEAAGGNL